MRSAASAPILFDLDATITRSELLPLLAAEVGQSAYIGELTLRTVAGEVDFAGSFRHRVDLLSPIPLSRVREIAATVELEPEIVAFIQANQDRCAVVTGNLDAWIEDLCRPLGVPVYCSTADVADGFVRGIRHILDKEEVALEMTAPFIAVGDGANDIGMLRHARIGVAYGGIHRPAPALLPFATYAVYRPDTLCQLLRSL